MTFRRAAALVLSILFVTTPALAQTGNRAAPSSRGVVPSQEFVFSDSLVVAQPFGPNQTTVRGRTRTTGSTLIRTRSQFVAEMFKSVENL